MERPLNGVPADKADDRLADQIRDAQKTVSEVVKAALTNEQQDALVSFVCNIGRGPFQQSTLLRLLNKGDYNAVPIEMEKWVKTYENGALVESPDLLRRRKAETALFRGADPAIAQSLSRARQSYVYESPSRWVTAKSSYSYAQNPGAVIAGIAVADASERSAWELSRWSKPKPAHRKVRFGWYMPKRCGS